jgi:hypothetical protein
MLRTKRLGAVASWALLAGTALAYEGAEGTSTGGSAAVPDRCQGEGATAASEADCADRAAATAPSVTPSTTSDTAESGTPARAAYVAGEAGSMGDPGDPPARGPARPPPDPDGVNTPDYWQALP